MADRLCDEIIAGTYKADDRIPSVREYAVMLQVNTNTAVKAYELLAREEIIYNRRGLGYFVSPGARKQIMTVRRKVFLSKKSLRLPLLVERISLQRIHSQSFTRRTSFAPCVAQVKSLNVKMNNQSIWLEHTLERVLLRQT